MKNKLLMTMLVVTSLLCGCVTFEGGAYKLIGSVSVMVDHAMQAWADYVVRGYAFPEQEAQVKALYGKYQVVMAKTKNAVMAYKQGRQDKTEVEAALDALQAAADKLSETINAVMRPVP